MTLIPVRIIGFFLVIVSFGLSWAEAPKVGKSAAARYFQQNPNKEQARIVANEDQTKADEDENFGRHLTFGTSFYTKSNSYKWGNESEEKVGKYGLDLMYRMKESSGIDHDLRVSYNDYEAASQRANKLSFMYALVLPDSRTKFPLYFGGAAGLGVFLTQLKDESPLSLDYQLFLGLRLFDIYDKAGFYLEGGLRNHIQLTSDGQVNGTYGGAGAVFSF